MACGPGPGRRDAPTRCVAPQRVLKIVCACGMECASGVACRLHWMQRVLFDSPDITLGTVCVFVAVAFL